MTVSSSKRYVRLPPDDELVARWRAADRNVDALAAEIGCSDSAIRLRLRHLDLPDMPRRIGWRQRTIEVDGRVSQLHAVINALERQHEADIEALAARIAALEARPAGFIEFRPNHRRIEDGGEHVRIQRRRFARGA